MAAAGNSDEEVLTPGPIIDCDVHVMRPEPVQSSIAEYLDPPYRQHVDPTLAAFTGAYPTHGQIEWAPSFGSEYTLTDSNGIEDPERDLDEALIEGQGIDIPVLNLGPGGIDELHEADRRAQEMAATNNVMLELFLDQNDAYVGLGTIAMSEPDAAVEEIERLADESQVVGLYTTVTHADPPLGDPTYDRIYEAAEDNEFPIVLHSGESSRHWPHLENQVLSYLEMYSSSNRMIHEVTLASMIYNGVPEKFPDLQFLCLGAGVGWAAAMMGRMNRDYQRRSFDAPPLQQEPETYIRDNWFFGTHPLERYSDPDGTKSLLELIGSESVVYGSNYPLYDFESPTAVTNELSLSATNRERIFTRNAIELFELGDRVGS